MTREERAALRVYRMIAELHRRGFECIRIVPGMSPSGCYYRSSVTSADNVYADHGALAVRWDAVAINTSGNGSRLFEWPDAPRLSIARLARRFIERYPQIAARGLAPDPEYVCWFATALALMERGISPCAYDDSLAPESRRPRWMPTLSEEVTRLPMPPPGKSPERFFIDDAEAPDDPDATDLVRMRDCAEDAMPLAFVHDWTSAGAANDADFLHRVHERR